MDRPGRERLQEQGSADVGRGEHPMLLGAGAETIVCGLLDAQPIRGHAQLLAVRGQSSRRPLRALLTAGAHTRLELEAYDALAPRRAPRGQGAEPTRVA